MVLEVGGAAVEGEEGGWEGRGHGRRRGRRHGGLVGRGGLGGWMGGWLVGRQREQGVGRGGGRVDVLGEERAVGTAGEAAQEGAEGHVG